MLNTINLTQLHTNKPTGITEAFKADSFKEKINLGPSHPSHPSTSSLTHPRSRRLPRRPRKTLRSPLSPHRRRQSHLRQTKQGIRRHNRSPRIHLCSSQTRLWRRLPRPLARSHHTIHLWYRSSTHRRSLPRTPLSRRKEDLHPNPIMGEPRRRLQRFRTHSGEVQILQ